MNKEFFRMQKLAGLITETKTNMKPNTQVTLYASFLLDTPEARKSDIKGNFPEDKIPTSFSGVSTPTGTDGEKNVILCTNYPWTLVTEPNTGNIEDLKILVVKFKKPLTDVFLDLDDFDLDSLGVEEKAEENLDFTQDTPLSEFIPYGLDLKSKWYGCFVTNISPGEIIAKKVGSQSEYFENGPWTSF